MTKSSPATLGVPPSHAANQVILDVGQRPRGKDRATETPAGAVNG